MKFTFVDSLEKREPLDGLLLPCFEGEKGYKEFEEAAPFFQSGDFKGKNGEIGFVYGKNKERIFLLGLGSPDQMDDEGLRRAFANGVREVRKKRVQSLNILLPRKASRGIYEGILLANYTFNKLKSKKEEIVLEKIGWIGGDRKEIERAHRVVDSIHFVRDLVNENSDEKPPQAIGEIARKLKGCKTTLLGKKDLEREKMGLMLAVSRASIQDPCLAIVSYNGNPKSKDHVVLVGKGVTYDTGGLHLKQPDNMMTMKSDMAGAAVVLGTIRAAEALELPVNVTGILPLVENSIGSKSFKLGDVYTSHLGKTVEIKDTDAEGRLILADAISYAIEHLKPACLIDVATLTGSIVVALGEEMAGFFSNDETVAKDLLASSKKTGEPLWRMPLNSDYKELLKSEIADLVNSAGRDGGCIKAALFLEEFAGSVPWAHIDFAGPAFLTKAKHYNTSKGTGYGVRLLLDFLERRAK